MYRIPESVTHADLMAAMRPLHELLGVTEREVFMGAISVRPSGSATDCVAIIDITLAARGADDTGERPRALTKAVGVSDAPATTAELAWRCCVKVV